jgi:uncharacterized protein YprB with RNaseH-like and TPR domain
MKSKSKAAKRTKSKSAVKRKSNIVRLEPRSKRPAKVAQFVPGAKVCLFDIESSDLNADWGYVLCVSYKWFDEDQVHTISILDSPNYKKSPTDDSWVIAEFGKVYEQADAVVAHFGMHFDLKFLNSRRLLYGMSPLPKAAFIDTWWHAKHSLRLKSNRLGAVADFFQLDQEKTPLRGSTWRAAAAGDRKAHAEVITHCEMDVLVLEGVYRKLRPIMWTHPNMNLAAGAALLQPAGNCPKCASDHLQRRGRYVTRTKIQVRMQCTECGGWHLLSPQKPDAVRIDDAFAKRKAAA